MDKVGNDNFDGHGHGYDKFGDHGNLKFNDIGNGGVAHCGGTWYMILFQITKLMSKILSLPQTQQW